MFPAGALLWCNRSTITSEIGPDFSPLYENIGTIYHEEMIAGLGAIFISDVRMTLHFWRPSRIYLRLGGCGEVEGGMVWKKWL